MRDKWLASLVWLVVTLVIAHDGDHLLRGDLNKAPDPALAARFVTLKNIVLVIAAIVIMRSRHAPLVAALLGAPGDAGAVTDMRTPR